MEINPEFASAHTNLGHALRRQEKLDEAAACFRRAIKIIPDNARTHNALGKVLHDEAERLRLASGGRNPPHFHPRFRSGPAGRVKQMAGVRGPCKGNHRGHGRLRRRKLEQLSRLPARGWNHPEDRAEGSRRVPPVGPHKGHLATVR